jgi:pimeloyl-ACP methyl ester carboxylesterase
VRVLPPLLAIEDAGAGRALVLLHGLATSSVIWASVIGELSRARRVVTVDLPGFGGSAPVGEDFDLHRVASRIARGLAARGVTGPYDVVGHSLGGVVAAALAASRPRSVGRLVLVAPAGLAPLPAIAIRMLAAAADPLLAARRRLAALAELPFGRRALLTFAAADGARIPPSQARMMVQASGEARRTSAALTTVGETDLLALLDRVDAPLDVIWGDADRTIPSAYAPMLAQARPDARIELIAGAGHVVMAERPSEFTAALLRLLDGS